MNFIKKIILYHKFKGKKFASVGHCVDFKQYNSKFLYPQNISIGDFSKILDYAFLDGVGGITVGECTIIGPQVTILTSNHNYDERRTKLLPFDNLLIKKAVVIGCYGWIGRGVTILPGVTIGKACVIGAGSVVTKDVKSYTVVGGNPAACLRQRDRQLIDDMINSGQCVANWRTNPHPQKEYVEG